MAEAEVQELIGLTQQPSAVLIFDHLKNAAAVFGTGVFTGGGGGQRVGQHQGGRWAGAQAGGQGLFAAVNGGAGLGQSLADERAGRCQPQLLTQQGEAVEKRRNPALLQGAFDAGIELIDRMARMGFGGVPVTPIQQFFGGQQMAAHLGEHQQQLQVGVDGRHTMGMPWFTTFASFTTLATFTGLG
ncbi:MAG: hypothetical protein FJ077_11610, partial [Cyanobacteria bacterium K_DeepCast_35m_m2_023]|nr:hypothetical protein [Cyanobacteria bacterium K_DeepCast_35m_m2_023]